MQTPSIAEYFIQNVCLTGAAGSGSGTDCIDEAAILHIINILMYFLPYHFLCAYMSGAPLRLRLHCLSKDSRENCYLGKHVYIRSFC